MQRASSGSTSCTWLASRSTGPSCRWAAVPTVALPDRSTPCSRPASHQSALDARAALPSMDLFVIEDACASTSPGAAGTALKRLEAERVPVISSSGPELSAIPNALAELPVELPVPKPEYSETFEAALERREEATQSAGRAKTATAAQVGLGIVGPKAAADKGRRTSLGGSGAPRVAPLVGLTDDNAAGIGNAEQIAGSSAASVIFNAVQHIHERDASTPAQPKRKLHVNVTAATGRYSAYAASSQTPLSSGIVPGFVSPSGSSKGRLVSVELQVL